MHLRHGEDGKRCRGEDDAMVGGKLGVDERTKGARRRVLQCGDIKLGEDESRIVA